MNTKVSEEIPQRFAQFPETFGICIPSKGVVILIAHKDMCELLLPILQSNTKDELQILSFENFNEKPETSCEEDTEEKEATS